MKEDKEEEQTFLEGPWKELPLDPMETIFQRMPIWERMRLSAVCKSWGDLFIRHMQSATLLPWLVLSLSPLDKSLTFLDLFDGSTLSINCPRFLLHTISCGSSKGWLVMSQITTSTVFVDIFTGAQDICSNGSNKHMFLFNPVSGTILELPPLDRIPYYNWFMPQDPPCVDKVELSSADPSKMLVAMLLRDDYYQTVLAVCRPQGQQWVTFTSESMNRDYDIYDVLFYKGELVAIYDPRKVKKVEVLKCSWRSEDIDLTVRLIPYHAELAVLSNDVGTHEDEDHFSRSYLVEARDCSLLVVRLNIQVLQNYYCESGVFNLPGYRKVRDITVFKIDIATGGLQRVHSLDKEILFVGCGGSLSIPARAYDDRFRGNRIFFVESNYDEDYILTSISRECGVYCLKDGSIRRPLASVGAHDSYNISWFTPPICK